jgi:cysteine-rich repeat protein
LFSSGAPALADHGTYDITVDRIEVDGPPFGVQDGTPDFIDDFGDGTLAPEWGVASGNFTETGGRLHLLPPGTHFPVPPISWEISIAGLPESSDGDGDVVATAVVDIPPSLNESFTIALGNHIDPNNEEWVRLQVFRVDTDIAALQGISPGVYILHEFFAETGGTPIGYNLVRSLVSLPLPSQVVLRLTLDDATDTITSEYSLDGGSTFEEPLGADEMFNVTSFVSVQVTGGFAEPSCGNGVLDPAGPGVPAETCDDGNTTSGDGCSATCQIEEPIPTLPLWGMILFAVLLLGSSSWMLRRRLRS